MKRLAFIPLFFAALVFNAVLFLVVPTLQAAFRSPPPAKTAQDSLVQREVVTELTRPEPPPPREIHEIKLEQTSPQPVTESRPSLPGGGLKLDLSAVGGAGSMALVSGGDRTGPLGSGAGGGSGSGSGSMVYEPGQTDADARISGSDQPPRYPPRAEREGVNGYVDLLFVVNESGFATQIQVLKEEPPGYGFAASATEAVRKLRFSPAMLQKIPVKQKVRRRINFEL